MADYAGSIRFKTEFDTSGAGKLLAQFRQLTSAAKGFASEFRKSFREGVEEGAKGATRQVGVLQSAFAELSSIGSSFIRGFASGLKKGFVDGMKGIPKRLKDMGNSIKSFFGTIRKNSGAGQNAFDKIRVSIGSLLKGLSIFALLRRAIQVMVKGIGESLQQYQMYNTETADQINGLKSALSGLQGAFVSAFAPLLSVVIPPLMELVNWLTTAINTIGMLFAAITGQKSYKKLTAANKAAAGSYKAVGDAAKEAAKGVASFDKLEIISSSSSSGGGSDAGTGQGWDIAPISEKIRSLADLFKNGLFFDFGYELAEMLANALDSIPWDRIQSAALRMGTALAEILNGVFANLHLAESLGRTIGEAINTALIFAFGFLSNFDFSQFGTFWGTVWNTFVETMQWHVLEADIAMAGNGIIDALTSFFRTIEDTCSTLGAGIGKILNGIFADIDLGNLASGILDAVHDISLVIAGAVEEIRWDDIAENFKSGIHTLIDGMRLNEDGTMTDVWAENGTAVGSLIQNFIHTVYEIVSDLDFHELGGRVADWFNNAFGEINWEEAGATLSELILSLPEFVTGFIEEADWGKLVDGIIEMINGLDPLGIIAALGALIFDSIQSVLDSIAESHPVLADVIEIIGTVTAVLAGLSTMMGIIEVGGTVLAGVFAALTSPIGLVVVVIGTLIAIGILLKNHWAEIKEFAAAVWDKIKEIVSGAIEKAKEVISNVMDSIKEKWDTVWDAVKSTAEKVWNWIKENVFGTFEDIKTSISDAMDNVKEKWESIWEGMSDFVKGIINGIIGFINGMLDALGGGLNKVIDCLNTLSFDVPDWVPLIGGGRFGFDVGHIHVPQIPYLADGAVIRGGDPFVAMLGDQPAGQVNVEAPLDTITDAVRAANGEEIAVLQEQNTILRQILAKNFGITEREVFRAVRNQNDGFISRNGYSAFAY